MTETWDIAVVGAGPAGALAAFLCARRGYRVLLIERATWPRAKVCGGCLSASAVRVLQEAGVGDVLTAAQPIDVARWFVGKQRMELATPGGFAIARNEFDALLVERAIGAGAMFLPNTAATLDASATATGYRTLTLRTGEGTRTIRAGMVLAADGIAGTALAGEAWARWEIAEDAYIGVAASCEDFPAPPPRGEIQMHAGAGGYVGLVQLADGRTHLAAALDPMALRAAGGPAALVARILKSCHRAAPTQWPRMLGTSGLTRSRARLGGARVLAIGDACAYVEPFTGEGMAWALRSAAEVMAILPAAGAVWPGDLPRRWLELQRRTVAQQQWLCRALRPMIHAPALTAAGVAVGNVVGPLRRFVAAQCR